MAKKRFKLVPACYLVLLKNDKILLLRRYNTGYEDGKYSFIAGHLDGDETFKQAMAREAKEEADIDLSIDKLEIIHIMHRSKIDNNDERIDIFMTIDKWKGEIKNMEPNKCDDLKWFPIDEIPNNIIPYIKRAISCIKKRRIYSEFGF